MTVTPRRTLAAAAAGVLIAITGTACSAGSSSSDDSSEDRSGDSSAASSDAGGSRAEGAAAPIASTRGAKAPDVEQQQVISTGSVRVRSKDVGDAAADVRRIVRQYGGTLDQDATDTDDDGHPSRAHLVVRVPVVGFDDALDALEAVGTLVSSDSSTQDVTTEVLDTQVRVEAARRSIDRIQVLFDQATSITDIVKIENELSTRQADLESLEQQQRYLQDQTSMSTIDVVVTRATTDAVPPDEDTSGFTAGLSAGWGGLKASAVAAATVTGALLPWAVLLALLGVPTWAVVRRTRRRRAPAV